MRHFSQSKRGNDITQDLKRNLPKPSHEIFFRPP
jgi:hypothetical protein